MKEERKQKIEDVVASRQSGVRMILEDIHDPHNAGAIQRTCDAFGIQHLHYIFDKEDPYDPQVEGAESSSSANKWLDFHTHDSTANCFQELQNQDYTIIATAAEERGQSLYDSSLVDNKIAIAAGNEHRGLSQEAYTHADRTVHLPMIGMVQSLNISVAAALFIYETTRQRIKEGREYRLTKEEQENIAQRLFNKS